MPSPDPATASPRFVDKAPHHQVWAELPDEDVYLCSPRTMYRLLEAHGLPEAVWINPPREQDTAAASRDAAAEPGCQVGHRRSYTNSRKKVSRSH